MEYYSSVAWRTKCKLVKERDGNRCVVCTSQEQLEVHHRTYDHFKDESLDDLVTLCKYHHEAITSANRERRYAQREHAPIENKPDIVEIRRNENGRKDLPMQDSGHIALPNAQRAVSRPIQPIFEGKEGTDGQESQDRSGHDGNSPPRLVRGVVR